MKRSILSNMTFLAVAACIAVLPGCDEKEDNGGASEPGPLTVENVSPVSGSTGLSNGINIVITFNRPTDGDTAAGTVTLTYDYGVGTDTLVYPNHVEDVMSFNSNKNILTINGKWDLLVGAPYFDLIVSGFKDANGVDMADYEDASYNFLTWTRAAYGYTPNNGAADVDVGTNIKIDFRGELGPEKGTVVLDYDSPDFGIGSITFTDPVNCTMSLETSVFGHNLVINPTVDLYTTTEYSNIRVSGFKDPYGHDVSSHTDAGYSFTTGDIN